MQQSEKKYHSQLRFDLVSKDWVVIAAGRALRPEDFTKQKREKIEVAEENCVFCNLKDQAKPVLEYKDQSGQNQLTVIPNKYPAFSPGQDLNKSYVGPYEVMDAIGFHEVIITQDHKKTLAEMPIESVKQVIDAYQARYLALMNEKFIDYISIFYNHGQEAGASIAHPHSQLMAISLIDPDLRRSLDGSKRYMEEHGKCVHCAMLEWDIQEAQRIIFQNNHFVALCPFAPRASFEIRIYPRAHSAYFEKISEEEKMSLAAALQYSLKKVLVVLNDPAYNFFLHTAPCDGQVHDHYHWHIEILPKTSTWAGFELGTGIEISTLEPETAAEFLRNKM